MKLIFTNTFIEAKTLFSNISYALDKAKARAMLIPKSYLDVKTKAEDFFENVEHPF